MQLPCQAVEEAFESQELASKGVLARRVPLMQFPTIAPTLVECLSMRAAAREKP
jgi:hypothetical protein